MNLLERAKAFVAAKASKIALTVVPLAALTVSAVPASASEVGGVVFNTAACNVTWGTGGTCSDTSSSPGADTDANLINLTSGLITSAVNGSVDEVEFTLMGSANGNAFGSPQSIPVSWDIVINTPSGSVNWSVMFEILSGPTVYSTVPDPITGTVSGTAQHVKGFSSITVPANVSVTGYEIQLVATQAQESSFTLEVPLTLNGTPEPSSWLLAASGALGFLFRRKKKS